MGPVVEVLDRLWGCAVDMSVLYILLGNGRLTNHAWMQSGNICQILQGTLADASLHRIKTSKSSGQYFNLIPKRHGCLSVMSW